MTCFRLAFSVQLVDVPLADGPLKTALVAPEIHGLRLPTSGRERPLDAFSLLVQRDVPGGFDLYTCSCGVAGCAGFHDEVELSVDGQALTWQIPLEPYRDLMPDAPWSDDGLRVRFDRAQYLQALDSLEQQLLQLEAAEGQLGLAPIGCEELITDIPPLAASLARGREYRLERQQLEEALSSAEAALDGRALVLWTAEDEGWLIEAYQLCRMADAHWELSDEALAVRHDGWVRFLHRVQEAPESTVREVDWETLECFVTRIDAQGRRLPHEGWPEAAWSGRFSTATVELVRLSVTA